MNRDVVYKKIRLQQLQIDVIIDAFKFTFLATDHLWIFGSRVDMSAKGGDIDLYVETLSNDASLVIDNKFKFVSYICSKIGEQKIDVVINMLHTHQELAIYTQAKQYGVKLI